MGPLFNGMTISAARDVLAAGTEARAYANILPQEIPDGGEQKPTDSGNDSPDSGNDSGNDNPPPPPPPEPEPNTTQRDDIDRSDAQSKPSEAQKIIEEINGRLDPDKNDPQVNKAAEDVGALVKATTDAKKATKAVEDIVDVAGAADPEAAIIGMIADAAEKIIENAFAKTVENAVLKDLEKQLDIAFADMPEKHDPLFDLETAMEQVGYSKVIDSGNPAAKNCAIAHSATAMVVRPTDIDSSDGKAPKPVAVAMGDDAQDLANIAAAAGEGGAAKMGGYYKKEGIISEGSSNVFFGGRAAARVNHSVGCDIHAYAKIAEGSKTVFANGWPIARVGNKLSCDGIVSEGVSRIFIDQDISSTFKLSINAGLNQAIFDLMPRLADYLPIFNGIVSAGKSLSSATDNYHDIVGDGTGG